MSLWEDTFSTFLTLPTVLTIPEKIVLNYPTMNEGMKVNFWCKKEPEPERFLSWQCLCLLVPSHPNSDDPGQDFAYIQMVIYGRH